ncbi:hypothetical protein GCM10018771_64820 [Streptomyces cellulosae]|nr:hypothetical protein GCM10018771_64820 [Streptomyces cellulosae]
MAASPLVFRAGSSALVRAVARPSLPVPVLPDLEDASPRGTAERLAWLRRVWRDEDIAEALDHASPVLAAQVRTLVSTQGASERDVRRAALSVARYLLRAQHRPTPFGLFAGVAAARFGSPAADEWRDGGTVVARAGAEWLAAVIRELEVNTDLLALLPVVANNTMTVRGDRLIVPFQAGGSQEAQAVETSLAWSSPLRTVIDAAQAPITVSALAEKLQAEYPEVAPERMWQMVQELVRRRVLLTSLAAPSTEPDALGHLIHQLAAVKVDEVSALASALRELREVKAELDACGTRDGRRRLAARMRGLVPGLRKHPLALDLRLDARPSLPSAVALEAERAALVLARVCAWPFGTPAWGAFHQRFYERYGIGSLVPVQEVVGDSGTGYPEGYPGAASGPNRPRLSERDDVLVRLAQTAALEGRDEVILTDKLVEELDRGPEEPRLPPHLEVGVRVYAADREELWRGRFRLEVVSVSRGAGVMTGRFLSVLTPEDRYALLTDLADSPTADEHTVPAQVSFPPLLPESAHVTRAPQVLPTVISVQEHRTQATDVLMPKDLAVGCDGRRLYLASPERGHRVEAVGMHALNLQAHTPPLVRFMTELSRAQCAQVTAFDWGAASSMPFLPRVRYGRTVLSPARWRLNADDLAGRARPRIEWESWFQALRLQRRIPERVQLVEGDQLLFLDLGHVGHRALLRRHLDRAGAAVLVEAPPEDAFGWCQGRAHEVVVPLKASRPPAWPAVPRPTPARAFSPAQTQTPGVSDVVLAALYGDIRRQDELLTRHLPVLLARLGGPEWWFIRFRDPDPHLRLRIALPAAEAFGEVVRAISAWADELRWAGLVSDLRYPTSFREMGRWGSGAAWEAAEKVFKADSRAVLAQLSQTKQPRRRSLVAAHIIAIASAFLGDTRAAMQWLIEHIPAGAPTPVPRPEFTEAVRLADPSHGWAALHATPGGTSAIAAWAERNAALAAYRTLLPGPETQGVNVDDVLTSLLHVHFVRHVAVNFPEEEICLYLTRAAALAWTAQHSGGRQ